MRGITGQEEEQKRSAILPEAELRGKTILYNLVICSAIAWWVKDKWGEKNPLICKEGEKTEIVPTILVKLPFLLSNCFIEIEK